MYDAYFYSEVKGREDCGSQSDKKQATRTEMYTCGMWTLSVRLIQLYEPYELVESYGSSRAESSSHFTLDRLMKCERTVNAF